MLLAVTVEASTTPQDLAFWADYRLHDADATAWENLEALLEDVSNGYDFAEDGFLGRAGSDG